MSIFLRVIGDCLISPSESGKPIWKVCHYWVVYRYFTAGVMDFHVVVLGVYRYSL